MQAIGVEKVCRTYQGKGFRVEALKDITLSVEKGEMVAKDDSSEHSRADRHAGFRGIFSEWSPYRGLQG